MFRKAAFPGKYIQGAGVIRELSGLIELLGKQGLILASRSVKETVLPEFAVDLCAKSIPIELFRGECCECELVRIFDLVNQRHADVLIGMGGGKTIDTAKIVADRAHIPVIVVPIIASTDAPCSGCAVRYSENGIFDSVCYQKPDPATALSQPTSVVASARGQGSTLPNCVTKLC